MPKRRKIIIREVREAGFYSLRDIASKADVSPATLSQIERGIRRPQRETIEKIAKALDCRVEDLTRVEDLSVEEDDAPTVPNPHTQDMARLRPAS